MERRPLRDPDLPPDYAARRLVVVAGAYGGPTAAAVLDAVPDRLRIVLDGVAAAAAAGDTGMAHLLALGESTGSRRRSTTCCAAPRRSARASDPARMDP